MSFPQHFFFFFTLIEVIMRFKKGCRGEFQKTWGRGGGQLKYLNALTLGLEGTVGWYYLLIPILMFQP